MASPLPRRLPRVRCHRHRVANLLGLALASLASAGPHRDSDTSSFGDSPIDGVLADALEACPRVVSFSTGGIARWIDGETVFRDAAIGERVKRGGSFLVTGRIEAKIFDCAAGSCPISMVWSLAGPVGRADGSQKFALLTATGTWEPPDARRWLHDLVVLRVRTYDLECPWQRFCDGQLLVEAVVPPAAVPPSVTYVDGRPATIDGEAVRYGSEIEASLARVPTASILAGGHLLGMESDCRTVNGCPFGVVQLLGDGPTDTGPRRSLLVDQALWEPRVPDDLAEWPGGITVLRVRAYDRPCPWDPTYCDRALFVEAVRSPG